MIPKIKEKEIILLFDLKINEEILMKFILNYYKDNKILLNVIYKYSENQSPFDIWKYIKHNGDSFELKSDTPADFIYMLLSNKYIDKTQLSNMSILFSDE